MGVLGLPDDLSSQSKFIRIAFTKIILYLVIVKKKVFVSFFYILNSVDQQCG